MPLPSTRFWNHYDRKPYITALKGALLQVLENEMKDAWELVGKKGAQKWRLRPEYTPDMFRNALERAALIWHVLPENRKVLEAIVANQQRFGSRRLETIQYDDISDVLTDLLDSFFDPDINGWKRFSAKLEQSSKALRDAALENFDEVMVEVMEVLDAHDATRAIQSTPRLDHLKDRYRSIVPNRVRALKTFEKEHRNLVNWILNPDLNQSAQPDTAATPISSAVVHEVLQRVLGDQYPELERIRQEIERSWRSGRYYRCKGEWFVRMNQERDTKLGAALFKKKDSGTPFLGDGPLLYAGAVNGYYDQIDPGAMYSVCWAAMKQIEQGEALLKLSLIQVNETSDEVAFAGSGYSATQWRLPETTETAESDVSTDADEDDASTEAESEGEAHSNGEQEACSDPHADSEDYTAKYVDVCNELREALCVAEADPILYWGMLQTLRDDVRNLSDVQSKALKLIWKNYWSKVKATVDPDVDELLSTAFHARGAPTWNSVAAWGHKKKRVDLSVEAFKARCGALFKQHTTLGMPFTQGKAALNLDGDQLELECRETCLGELGWPAVAAALLQSGSEKGRQYVVDGLSYLQLKHGMPEVPLSSLTYQWLAEQHFARYGIEVGASGNTTARFLAIVRDERPRMLLECEAECKNVRRRRKAELEAAAKATNTEIENKE